MSLTELFKSEGIQPLNHYIDESLEEFNSQIGQIIAHKNNVINSALELIQYLNKICQNTNDPEFQKLSKKYVEALQEMQKLMPPHNI